MKCHNIAAFPIFLQLKITKMKNLFTILLTVLLGTTAIAQNNVGINTPSPDASAALDVTSTNQGVLVPRMSKSLRDLISIPATGLLVWQTDNTPGFYFNSGTPAAVNWIHLGATGPQGATGATGPAGQQGPIGVTGAIGAAGPAGPQGQIGQIGATGSVGPAGPQGLTGQTGAAGAAGATGTQGQTGAAGTAGANGQGVATGGTANQVLAKVDGTNYNTKWVTPSAVAPAATAMPNAFYGHVTASLAAGFNYSSPFSTGNTSGNPQAITSFLIPVACSFTIKFYSFEDDALTFELYGVTPVANLVSYTVGALALASCSTAGWVSGAPIASSFTFTAVAGQVLTIKTYKTLGASATATSGGYYTQFAVN